MGSEIWRVLRFELLQSDMFWWWLFWVHLFSRRQCMSFHPIGASLFLLQIVSKNFIFIYCFQFSSLGKSVVYVCLVTIPCSVILNSLFHCLLLSAHYLLYGVFNNVCCSLCSFHFCSLFCGFVFLWFYFSVVYPPLAHICLSTFSKLMIRHWVSGYGCSCLQTLRSPSSWLLIATEAERWALISTT